MTDSTQEHMHNSGEATSCAQRSAQAELGDAPDLSDTHTIVDIPWFGKVWAVKNIASYYDTWLDWHNKQVDAVLDRLVAAKDSEGRIWAETIEAERKRLNPSNSTPFNKLKESK